MTQTQEAKHTPGKLRVQYDPGNPNPRLVANDGLVAVLSVGPMFVEPQDANAERLAACWNCHDALVDALNDLLYQAREICSDCEQWFDATQAVAAIAEATPAEAAQ